MMPASQTTSHPHPTNCNAALRSLLRLSQRFPRQKSVQKTHSKMNGLLIQLVKKFPAFKEPKSSTPCLQNSILCAILSQLNSVYTFIHYFSTVFLILSYPLRLDLCISHLSYVYNLFQSSRLTLLDLITLTIRAGQNKLWSSLLCNFSTYVDL
jgi:hypothetical protein